MYNFNISLADSLRNRGYEVVLLTPPGPYAEKIVKLGFNWISAPMNRRSLNFFNELIFLYWLSSFLKRERINLIHSFTIKCAIYGSLASRFSKVTSRVNAVTGMGYVFTSDNFKAKLLKPLISNLMKIAFDDPSSRLILLNKDDLGFFNSSKIVDMNLIRLLPGAGIDCNRFKPRRSAKQDLNFCVLLAARMLWDKGIAEFVEAARILLRRGRKINFLLAGSPDPGNPAAVPVEDINVWVQEGLVKWLGHVNDMPNLYHSVDVVVLPSYREGLPTGLTEAGSCGLPLITTDVPGCREVVLDEVDGILIPPRDSIALANAIARLQDAPFLCKQLGSAARQKALAFFDQNIVIERTLAIYDELI